ncbi:hypothetical protein ACVNPS_09055 [Candidatus Bipolaricaulota sp. J31]
MRLEYLLVLTAGLLLLLLLWPKGKDEAPVGPVIEVEGESLSKWSIELSLARELPALARDVHSRIVLASAALTAAAYPAGSPELAATAQKTRPRIMIAWAALSTSVLPQASGDLARKTSGTRPRILVERAALTTFVYPQGPPAPSANPKPRVHVQGAALSTLIQDFRPAPNLAEETEKTEPRVILEAVLLGQVEELGPPPELPEE